jgi:hypothetical protein
MPNRKKNRKLFYGGRKIVRAEPVDWDDGTIPIPPSRGHEKYEGYLDLDFSDAKVWNVSAFEGQDDQYGHTYVSDGVAANHPYDIELNDGTYMLDHRQIHADGGNKYYFVNEVGSPRTDLIGSNSFRFRWLLDVPGTDTGHSCRFINQDTISGEYIIWKVLGNGIIQCQVSANTRINQSGLTPGNLTVMGYYDAVGTYFYMKAKNGFDASMSWTLWDGSDADAFGSYDEGKVLTNAKVGIGAGSDTVPLTHGWTKTFEFMTSDYSGWA